MNAKLVSNVVCCLCSVVFLVTCSTSARTEAASYQTTYGTIVDPILDTGGSSNRSNLIYHRIATAHCDLIELVLEGGLDFVNATLAALKR